jgi:hypothetical protein
MEAPLPSLGQLRENAAEMHSIGAGSSYVAQKAPVTE